MAFVDFNRGELSPNMRYRSDLAAQHRGVERMENMLPTPRGGLVRRPGSQVLELLPPSETGSCSSHLFIGEYWARL